MARTAIVGNTVQPLGLPNGGVSSEQGTNWNDTVSALNTMLIELYGGSAAPWAPGGGTISNTVGPVGSSATNTSQTLASYTVPASTLATAGQQLQIIAWGRTANNAAPKQMALKFGGAAFQTGTQTGAAYTWSLEGLVMKSASNQQNIRYQGVASGGALTLAASTDTSIDTSTIAVSVTCADASAAQSNILMDGFTVRYFR